MSERMIKDDDEAPDEYEEYVEMEREIRGE